MSSFEDSVEASIDAGKVPGIVVLAKNKTGTFNYAKAFGPKSLAEGSKPMPKDAVFVLASMTKLMTTIAALQVVERGLVKLDDDLASHLPELAAVPILTGFDSDGKPTLKKRENAITLRHLLTHSAGIGYDVFQAELLKFREYEGKPVNTGPTIAARFSAPLMYEPGTGWAYGAAIDWAGKLVEVLTDSDLETYMRTHIWTPLEISDITFWPYKQAALSARIPGMMARGPDGKLAEFPGLLYNPADFEDAFGGQGAYAVLPEYLKILDSILADDETLLKKETTALMFEPQLTKQSAAAQKFAMQQPSAKMMVGEFVEGVEVNWGLGGILMMDGDEGRRKSRTLIWSGMPNLFWFIDREAGLCGIFGTQVLPPGDGQVEEIITLFEKAMYQKMGAVQG